MRHLKFNGIKVQHGKVIVVEDIFIKDGLIYDYTDKTYDTPNIEVEHIVNIEPIQYTGRKDINGNELYEYMIVKGKWPYATKAVIVWDDKRCGFFCKPLDGLGRASYDKYYKMNSVKLTASGYLLNGVEYGL